MNKYIYFFAFLLVCNISAKNTQETKALDQLELEQVAFVNFMFSDLTGKPKEVTIASEFVSNAIKNGIYFDGSSISGFGRINASDMVLKADINTLQILPWTNYEHKTARFVCDVYEDDRTPFSGDPRYRLKTVMQEAHDMGYDFYVGPEIEFFICEQQFDNQAQMGPCDTRGYFDNEINTRLLNFKCNIVNALRSQNIAIEKLHHEVAPGQHEIVIHYNNALTIADQIIIAKQTIQTLAQSESLNATFMPKPFYGKNGSGMHMHFSLWDHTNNCNAFYSKDDPYYLSKTARHFIAGVLKYIAELSVLFNPTINSYKRLVPGYEAPTNICWGVIHIWNLPHY